MSPLRLQFAVSHEEASEAQSLVLRHQVGGGSKLAALLLLTATLIALLAAFYFQLPRGQRSLWFGILVVIWIGALVWTRAKKKPTPQTNTVEITPQSLRLITSGADLDQSWSAFSQLLESQTLFVLVDRTKTVLITLPKRAFPDQSSQNWFRSLLDTALAQSPKRSSQIPVRATDPDALTLHFRYTYREYLGYTLATWFTRLVMLGVLGVIGYVIVQAYLRPVPNAVYSTGAVLLMMSPFFLLIFCMPPLIFSIKDWLAVRKQVTEQTVILSNDGLTMTEPTGDTHLHWSNLRFYKETRRLFILWSAPRAPALMLPKRAISSESDVQKLRALLDKHLQKSSWLLA